MDQVDGTGSTHVLWVQIDSGSGDKSAESSRPSPLERALVDARDAVERVDDVYHALARVLRATSRLRAVFVSLDDLDPPEFEFFSLMSRRQAAPRVYVFGSERASDKLDWAVRLGAAGGATVELIHRALEEGEAELRSDVEPQPESEPAAAPLAHDEDEPPGATMDDDDRDEPASAQAGDTSEGDDADGPLLRVPWRTYGDQPVRRAPGRRPPEARDLEPEDRHEPSDAAHEPLLTNEELRALIGDDIDVLAARERGERKDSP